MRSAAIAEWLLAHCTDRLRATSIVGDLQEEAEQKGGAWFWWSVMGVALSLAVRPVSAVALACLGGGFATTAIASRVYGSFAVHAPDIFQRAWTTSLAAVLGLVWMIGCYSAVRFGIRDELTRAAIGFPLIGTVAVCFWWQPMVPLFTGIAAVTLLCGSILNPEGRKGVGAFALLSAVQIGIWIGGPVLFATAIAMGARLLHMHADDSMVGPLKAVTYGFLLVLAWLSCAMCSRVHRALLGRHTDNMAPDEYPNDAVPGL